MILKGRTICRGNAEGTVLKLDEPLSFLGGVDSATGNVKNGRGNVSGKILVFPKGKGSTVGSYVMYDLKSRGKAPKAVINSSAETIVATGAVISSIPMVDGIDVRLILDNDRISVDADSGTVELPDVRMRTVASSVVLVDGKILMLHRPETAKSYPGYWSLCAGKKEEGEEIEETASREIFEETRISAKAPIKSLPPVYVREDSTVWEVYTFIFDAGSQKPVLNKENTEYRLVALDELKTMKLVDYTYEVAEELLRQNQESKDFC